MAAAAGNYLKDLSSYLSSGNLSDLTLTFGDKTWKLHKPLVGAHSEWFHKAVNGGFQETVSGTIVLEDDPQFANAIDCMVSYFYSASYDAKKYDTLEVLLHAQVAIIADEYICNSLYELATASFENAIKDADVESWAKVAALVYGSTNPEVANHAKLRKFVTKATVAGGANRPALIKNNEVIQLLRFRG